MMDLTKLSIDELRELSEAITDEFYLRQEKLRETCTHEEYISIMYMRPGATYLGCRDCQEPKPRDKEEFWNITTNESTY